MKAICYWGGEGMIFFFFFSMHNTYLRHMKPSTRRRPRSSDRTADRCAPSAWFCATDVRTSCRCCWTPAVVWRPTWPTGGAAAAAACVAACPTTWWSFRGRPLSAGFSCRVAWSRCSAGPSRRPADWHCLKERKTNGYIKYSRPFRTCLNYMFLNAKLFHNISDNCGCRICSISQSNVTNDNHNSKTFEIPPRNSSQRNSASLRIYASFICFYKYLFRHRYQVYPYIDVSIRARKRIWREELGGKKKQTKKLFKEKIN